MGRFPRTSIIHNAFFQQVRVSRLPPRPLSSKRCNINALEIDAKYRNATFLECVPFFSEWSLRRAEPKGTVNPMRTFRTIVLAVSFFTLATQAFAQSPGADLADANNQAVLQSMQQSRWYSQDPYHRGYGYSGPDYTCPQQPTIVNAPAAAAGPQSSAPQSSNPANVTTAPDANSGSPAPKYINQDIVPAPAPANQDTLLPQRKVPVRRQQNLTPS